LERFIETVKDLRELPSALNFIDRSAIFYGRFCRL